MGRLAEKAHVAGYAVVENKNLLAFKSFKNYKRTIEVARGGDVALYIGEDIQINLTKEEIELMFIADFEE